MGIDALRNMSKNIGDSKGASREFMNLVPGNRMENFQELRNVRLEYDGPYLRIKRRGGTTIQKTVFGSVVTLYPFATRVSGVLKDFLAIHNTAGDILLWNITDNSSTTILTGFPTNEQIQITHNGEFLYAFSYDAGTGKYYDINAGSAFTFMNYDQSYILSDSFLTGELTDENFYNFSKGEQVLVYPNASWTSGVPIVNSQADNITEGVLDPSQYDVNSFRYVYQGGQYLTDAAGNDYKSTRFFTFGPGDAPLSYTVNGSSTEFVIEKYYIPLDENGDPSFKSYVAKLTDVGPSTLTWQDPTGIEATTAIGDPSTPGEDYSDRNIVFPYNPDLKSLVGQPANKQLSSGGDSVESNSNYSAPKIYRGYFLLDQLNDGSIALPGRPYQAELQASEIYDNGSVKIKFTVSPASSNVFVRFLCATRWKASPEQAFTPSSPGYENSPFFIIREVDKNKTVLQDSTIDDKLLRPLIEEFPMSGGVSDLFGPGQIKPNSIAPFEGSLMMAGYEVNRPIPSVYTNPATASQENIYVNITPTTQLSNNMALAFMFEYSDGKRSNIVETNEYLQKGSTSSTTPVACDQTKASGFHTVTQGCQVDGDLTVTYQGITVTVSLNTVNQATPPDVAEAIRAAVVASATMRITATTPQADQVQYTEKRFGESFNNDVVNIEPVPIASTANIDVTANALAASPSEGYYDVTANNLAASSSENHTLTIDGNATGAITINDTDTLEGIVDKYVSAINGDGTISADWTASKVDNGDGTWRCLLSSNVTNSSWDGSVLSISGDVDVTVAVQTPTAGGDDGQEDHTITVGATTTAAITVVETDTLEGIVDKYVAQLNGNGTISANWTASKVDIGGGNWRCLITSDTPGASDNGTTIGVSGTVDVTVAADAQTAGGTDGPGVTFDTQDPSLSGAQNPQGVPAKGFIAVVNNRMSGSDQGTLDFEIDGSQLQNGPTIYGSDTLEGIASQLSGAINSDPTIFQDWSALSTTFTINGPDYPGVIVEADQPGTSWNDIQFIVRIAQNKIAIDTFKVAAPGESFGDLTTGYTAGGSDGCQQAIGGIDVTANALSGGSTEDHTISIDGNATNPITIADTDTLEGIVDKYIAEIQNTPAIDFEWKATKVDNGDGTWKCQLAYRQYGTVGNGLVIDVTGDVGVTTAATDSIGGGDAGTVPSGSASEVNANRLQIHSLNNLVSKVYVLGRTNDGTKHFHLIKEIGIRDAGAHGKIIDLPNTTSQLDDIQASTFNAPTGSDILESVDLQNYIIVGIPFQQFEIPGQKPIQDQAEIKRAIPLKFDIDKTLMRYQFLIVTDRNLQMAYLVDQGGAYKKDIEKFYEGFHLRSREGAQRLGDYVVLHSEDGLEMISGASKPQKIVDNLEYDFLANDLKASFVNRARSEFWFIFDSDHVLVYDYEDQAVRTFVYDGPQISSNVRHGVYAHDNVILAIGGDVCYGDLLSVYDDVGQGASDSYYIQGSMTTKHLGNPRTQFKILEVDVGGQAYNVQVELDLQRERLESNTNSWSKAFSADDSSPVEVADISGNSFQFHKRAIMPKMRINITGDGDGFISSVDMKYLKLPNLGKARQ